MAETTAWILAHAARELLLFAAFAFLIGGLDEFVVDLVWMFRWVRRRLRFHHLRVDAASLAPAERSGRIAVLVPAWDESAVIGAMLRTAIARFGAGDWLIYVAIYPNDSATVRIVEAVAADEPRVRPVLCTRPGPTTKADALNHAWAALTADERRERPVKAIVLHDAEDVVHAAEMRIFDRLIERFDLVQLPVLPLLDPTSRWVAGHYADAFAEAHGKTLVVREAVGAAVPSAGVGCALSRRAIGRIAAEEGGQPFDPSSLTEDYVLGLRVRGAGGRSCFVRLPGAGMKGVVSVREHFPADFDGAVKQKARWMVGIALDGWDRLGWSGSWAERWMRLRDRRPILAAAVLVSGYAAFLLWPLALSVGAPLEPVSRGWRLVLWANGGLLLWRVAMRFLFVRAAYGWGQACLSVPRLLVGNAIDIAAAWRALLRYRALRRSGAVVWDKTAHRFPDDAALALE